MTKNGLRPLVEYLNFTTAEALAELDALRRYSDQHPRRRILHLVIERRCQEADIALARRNIERLDTKLAQLIQESAHGK